MIFFVFFCQTFAAGWREDPANGNMGGRPPEVLTGSAWTPQADIYSLGIMMMAAAGACLNTPDLAHFCPLLEACCQEHQALRPTAVGLVLWLARVQGLDSALAWPMPLTVKQSIADECVRLYAALGKGTVTAEHAWASLRRWFADQDHYCMEPHLEPLWLLAACARKDAVQGATFATEVILAKMEGCVWAPSVQEAGATALSVLGAANWTQALVTRAETALLCAARMHGASCKNIARMTAYAARVLVALGFTLGFFPLTL
jgi:hypothetical protein